MLRHYTTLHCTYTVAGACAVCLQVVFVATLTGLIQFPNIYTRINASEVIRQLFSQCGPLDTTSIDLW